MGNIATIIKTVCLAAALFVVGGCAEEGIIPRNDMALIISEMYLVDQVLEDNPKLKMQADSMLVYPAIMERNGYTLEEYEASMLYYMSEGESFNEILKDAKERLGKREKELNRIVKETHNAKYELKFKEWWASDSVRSVNPQEFLYDKLLRSVRWMAMRDQMKQSWTILDSAIVDIPQNPQWWVNTVVPGQREYTSIIVRGTGKEEKKTDKKLILENEKNSIELPVPIKRRAADKKRIPAAQRLK